MNTQRKPILVGEVVKGSTHLVTLVSWNLSGGLVVNG